METERLDDPRLPAPAALRGELPASPPARGAVRSARREIADLLAARDERLLVILGPCSIHDPAQALLYGERLAALRSAHGDALLLVMRCYFEKPRTTVGWKGWLYDPHLDGSGDLGFGVSSARRLLLDLALRGVPAATEIVDPLLAPYLEDLLAFAVVGARTVESPLHRQLASGLEMPVGFKNGTGGDVGIAVDALLAAATPARFPAIDAQGRLSIRRTEGNPHGCLILRGGPRPNFHAADLAAARERLAGAGPRRPLLVDCSHGNSGKDHRRQARVFRSVLGQLAAGAPGVAGLMLESHLLPGRQSRAAGRPLAPGISITDACIGWAETRQLVEQAADLVRSKRRRGAGMLA